jgi:hypothetical protein
VRVIATADFLDRLNDLLRLLRQHLDRPALSDAGAARALATGALTACARATGT